MNNRRVLSLVPILLFAVGLAGCKEASRFAWAAESRGFYSSRWPAPLAGLEFERRSASQGLSHYLSGLLAEGKWDFPLAEMEYLKAHQSDPESALIPMHLGTVSMKMNDIPKAIGSFETASRLDPADPRPRFLLGILYTSQERFEEAANEYSKVLALDPENLGALSYLADLYLLQEKLQEALKVYERLLEERPDSPMIHFNIGVLYAKANQWAEAIGHLRQAVELDPSSVEARLGLGVSLELSGNLVEAKQQFLQALELEPANARLIHYLAQISYRMGALEEAAGWLSRYLSFKPRETDGYLELGNLRIEQGQWQEAVRLFKMALELQNYERPPTELWLALGQAYQAGGDREEAEAAYQNALKINPDSPEALNGLGYLYAEWEVHLEEAVGLVRQALSQDPQNGAYLDSLGWVLFKLGRLQEALQFLKEASSRMPDPEVFYHLGQVYSSLGDAKGAKAAWEQGLALEAKDPEVTQRLKSMLKGHNRKSKGKVRSF